MNFNPTELIARAERDCAQAFQRFEGIEYANTKKLLNSFKAHEISYRHFAPTTGYGYDDVGRDTLSMLFAEFLGTETALVRPQIASGTHALAICLFGMLRPGDTLLSASGAPYDTLGDIIGLTGKAGDGSLKDLGVNYKQVELREGKLDIDAILAALDDSVKLVEIQRSRGYDWRASLGVGEINEAIDAIHKARPSVCVMVDNCYGEFTDTGEPRADVLAGSLIKNAGGGFAPTGAYLAGTAACMEKIAYRLTSPGIGAEVGSYAASYRPFYQGLFLAPHVVCQALKTQCLFSRAFELMGYEVHPKCGDVRNDIIQAIRFGDADKLIRFIQLIQEFSPIDSQAIPEPWEMPGYQDKVIMAAGTFVSGASIELSADAPIRPPFIAYMQGGLSYTHGKIVLEEMLKRGI
ncbi:MAG: methionine gamma-lyase family protein [Clostridia bacterium]|nr:methionine gamma-lyase family protein [Clostridia bacterium]